MPGYAFLDVNNTPNIVQFLEEIGAGEPMYRYKQSGYATYPLFKFNDQFLDGLETI